jgi:hypothetical protein
LFGADLDELSAGDSIKRTRRSLKPHIVLAIYDRSGNVQYEKFGESLRGTYSKPSMSNLEKLDLTVGSFIRPEIDAGDFDDFSYLFSETPNGLQTKYCYWNDPDRSIKTLDSKHILGIGGPIEDVEELKPIFLLDLEPPRINWPDSFPKDTTKFTTEQFFFLLFGGFSFEEGKLPLVNVMLRPLEIPLDGFTFRNPNHNELDPVIADWRTLAKREVREEEVREEEVREEEVGEEEVGEEEDDDEEDGEEEVSEVEGSEKSTEDSETEDSKVRDSGNQL